MALTPETGAGLSTANSYVTLAEFKAHHTARGVASVTDGTYDDATMEAAVVQATDYIDKLYGIKFKGVRLQSSQALAWPRVSAFDSSGYALTGVPSALKKATHEYGLIVLGLDTKLAPNVEPEVLETKEVVGPIESHVKYDLGKSSSTKEYPEADLWLKELVLSSADREVHRG